MITEEPSTMSVEVAESGELTTEQANARTAFNTFCWNLQLARARQPHDPDLSRENAAMITELLTMSDDAVAAKGAELWSAWTATGGHETAPAVFSQQSMHGFLQQLGAVRAVHTESVTLRQQLGQHVTSDTERSGGQI
jgi:hypothetical protein